MTIDETSTIAFIKKIEKRKIEEESKKAIIHSTLMDFEKKFENHTYVIFLLTTFYIV